MSASCCKGQGRAPLISRIRLLSSSPRRREIISSLAIPVDIGPSKGDEPRPDAGESPEAYVLRSAVVKLGTYSRDSLSAVDAAADTVVVVDDEILGKPSDNDEARNMLRLLRGRWHKVLTGIAVRTAIDGNILAETETSAVLTRDYSDGEIETYIARREPFDKAGGYAVQDDTFAPVLRIDGCYLNVVGLPLCLVLETMASVVDLAELRPSIRVPYHDRCENCRLSCVWEGTS